MSLLKKLTSILLILSTISSCATTVITVHKSNQETNLNTEIISSKKSVLVLWGTAWRKDQKEPKLREDFASNAINKFFLESKLFSDIKVIKTYKEKNVINFSDIEALELNKNEYQSKYEKIIFIRVEELGPTLNLYLSPILFDGSTEVKLRVRVLDTNTSKLNSDIYSEWKNSGPFVLKGIKTLEQDMYDNLKSIFGL